MIVKATVAEFRRGRFDGGRKLRRERPKTPIGARGSELLETGCVDEAGREALRADSEDGERALSLGTPIAIRRDFDLSEGIALDPCRGAHDVPPQTCAKISGHRQAIGSRSSGFSSSPKPGACVALTLPPPIRHANG